MGMSGQFYVLFAPEENAWFPIDGRPGELLSQCGFLGDENNLYPCWE
jgi:hypothetical protein